jgi:hypothetical protein
MELRDLRQGFDRAIHRVAAQRAVHVHVDKAGGDEVVLRVDHLRVFGPQHLRRWRHLFDLAAINHDAMLFQHTVRSDHPSIDDDHHVPRSMASDRRPDKPE